MPIILLILFRGIFWYESQRSQADIKQIIQGSPEQVEQYFQEKQQQADIFNRWQLLLWILGAGLFILFR